MPEVVAYIDQTPPSSNTNSGVGGRGKPQTVARTKETWQGLFAAALLAARLPRRCSMIQVFPELKFKRKGRAPDADNFYFAISKPLGDCLVKGGWLEDDNPDHYACERPVIVMGATDLPPLPKGRTTLRVVYEQ